MSTPQAPANTVLGQIERQTNDAHVRLAMALGALLEGGSLGAGPFPTGDNGQSPGPFQIRLYDNSGAPVHGNQITRAQAQNPADAVAFMLSTYTNAAGQVSAALWNSNPEQAAEQTAYMAERPAQDYYTARGADTVHSRYQAAAAGLAGAPVSSSAGSSSTDATATPAGYGSIGGFPLNPLKIPGYLADNAVTPVAKDLEKYVTSLAAPIVHFFENAALVIFGAVFLLLGLYLLARESGNAPSLPARTTPPPAPAEAAAE